VKLLTKLRVYEYAKQLNMSSKEIVTILSRLDVPVANHMSVMDDHMVKKVEQFFSDVKKRAADRHATEVERELREKQRLRERAAREDSPQRQTDAQSPTNNRANQNGNRVNGTGTPASPGSGLSTPSNARSGQTSSANYRGQSDAGVREVNNEREQTSRAPQTDGTTAPRAESGVVDGVRTDQQNDARVNGTQSPGVTPSQATDRPSSQGQFGRDSRPAGAGDSRPRPAGQGSYNNGRPSSGGTTGSRPAGQGGQSGYAGNRPAGQSGYAGNRPSSGQGGYAGNRPSGGQGGQGGYAGNRPSGGQGGQGGYGGNRSSGGQGGQGGYGGNRPSGGQGGQGGYGGNRPSGGQGGQGGNRPSGGQGGPGGNRGGQGSGFGARSGGGLGGRPGGAGRPAAGGMSSATKPSAPGSLRKDKDKVKSKDDFGRDRKEQFNEDKLVRGGRRRSGGGQPRPEVKRPEPPSKVSVDGSMTVGDFAKLLKREPSDLIKKLLFLGVMATINQEIDIDAMELIAAEYQVELTVLEPVDEEAVDMLVEEEKSDDLVLRSPVVTIMGHVDHGKTTLLDAIRESKVTSTEAGGITQHIGAYQVETNDRKITFLDTPGHEAFTTMRARGAQVTDVTILVVAADDGVMPQTVEAINHAKAANVPIIVAVNKMDKPGANPDRVKQELTQYGLLSEEWGGDTVFAHISALKREGLDGLLEMVLLVSDLADLKANPKGRPRGTVIEAKLDKGRGPVATVLVQNGTLKVGDIVVAGQSFGKVRAMLNDLGKRIKEAGPSTPVEIQGLGDVPSAGDLFVVYDDERAARNLAQKRTNRERAEQMQTTSRVTLDDLYRQIKEGTMKDLNVIVKADMQGSVEALVQSIEKIDVEGVRVKVIHKGAGAITESDVSLASASNAIVIGFHVRPDVNASRAAETEKVDIRLYRVIYNVIEELESAMKGMLDPEYKEVVLGHAEVRQVFSISKIGTVAGCYVTDGKMARDAEVRLIRDGIVVHEGMLDTLKRFKDDAKEVQTGYECGITLEKFNDIKVGDVVEAFKMEAVKVH